MLLTGEIRKKLQDLLEARFGDQLPGLVIAVVKERDFESACWGESQKGVSASLDTVFSIASCSKAFNATAISLRAQESDWSWDTSVKDVLGSEYILQDTTAQDSITLRDLVCHRSGLPAHLPALGAFDKPKDVVERLRHIKPTSEFGTRYCYENSGIITSAYCLSKLTGKLLPEIVQDKILGPLGMDSTTYYPSKLEKDKLAHSFNICHQPDGSQKLRRVPFWLDRSIDGKDYQETCLEAQYAPGGVCTTANDLRKWVQFWLAQGRRSDGKQMLSAEMYKQMTTPQIFEDSPEKSKDDQSRPAYGLGWRITNRNDKKVVEHGGGQRGVCANIAFCPDDGFGIVMLSNVTWESMGALEEALLSHFLDGTVFDFTWPQQDTIQPAPIPNMQTDTYCGTYLSPIFGKWTLENVTQPGPAVEDFRKIGKPFLDENSLYARSDRFWWTHLRISPKQDADECILQLYNFYPDGFGDDATPALETDRQGTITFLLSGDEITGFLVKDLFAAGHVYPGDSSTSQAEIVFTRQP